MISFECGSCGRKLQAPEKLQGKERDCPNCGSRIQVPSQLIIVPPVPVETTRVERVPSPFDLKGDALGMTLNEFKKKYFREVGGGDKPAPYCSDRTTTTDNVMLLQEPWHRDAGIVTARKNYPWEEYRGKGTSTIAGVTVKLLVYFFVDGEMYQIVSWIPSNGYYEVREAFVAKYGEPNDRRVDKIQMRSGAFFDMESLNWSNGVSDIIMRQINGSLDTSLLQYIHRDLNFKAENRNPGPAVDDI